MQGKQQKISPIKQRILQYADILGISKRQFYEKIGVSRGTLESNTGITEDVVAKFIAIYPEISPEWLLTGNGEMLRGNKPAPAEAKESFVEVSKMVHTTDGGIPLIPLEALAGIPASDNIGVKFEDCTRYNVPDFEEKGVEFLIRVSGSSMYPKYSSGDILACKRIIDILFFQWGKIYVIDSSQGILVKRIFEDATNPDNIILVSDNKDNYPPFSFPKIDIRSLSIVIGVIRLE